MRCTIGETTFSPSCGVENGAMHSSIECWGLIRGPCRMNEIDRRFGKSYKHPTANHQLDDTWACHDSQPCIPAKSLRQRTAAAIADARTKYQFGYAQQSGRHTNDVNQTSEYNRRINKETSFLALNDCHRFSREFDCRGL